MSKDTKNAEKPVKKNHGCRNCFLAALILFVIFGVGAYITGDYFTKKYVDLRLHECIKVSWDVTHASKKKIVTNAHSSEDFDSFEREMKAGLFIKDEVNFSLTDMVDSIFETDEQNNEDGGLDGNEHEGENYAAQVGAKNAKLNPDGIVEEISSLLSRENLDLERLRGYDESRHDEYVFHVSDRMIAAAINESIDTLGNYEDVSKYMRDYQVDRLSDVARLDQVLFGETDGTIDGEPARVKTLHATLSIDVRTIANTAIRQSTGKNMSFLVKMFLPKRLYISVRVPVQASARIEDVLFINNMDAKQMRRAYKLIDGIMEQSNGKAYNVQDKIATAMSKGGVKFAEKIERFFPISKAHDGVVDCDIFEALVDVSKINKNEDGSLKPEDEQMHAPDLIKTLAGVVAPEPEKIVVNALTPDSVSVTGTTMADYEFGRGLVNGYTLNDVPVPGSHYSTVPVMCADEKTTYFTLEQLNIFAAGEREKFFYDRTDFLTDVAGGTPDKTSDYLEFTFSFNPARVMDDQADATLTNLLPEKIYVTLLLQRKNTEYSFAGWRINALTGRQQELLLKLVGLKQADLQDQIDECVNALNDKPIYKLATFVTNEEGETKGYGKITILESSITDITE